MRDEAEKLAAWWADLRQSSEDRELVVHDAYQALADAGYLAKVKVHEYICSRCVVLGTAVQIGSSILLRTADYKLGPGMNERESVEAARRKNTLDGDRWWPGHTYDVGAMAEWGPEAQMTLNCRHLMRMLKTQTVLDDAAQSRPGKPGKTVLHIEG